MMDEPVGAGADGVEAGYTLALRPGTHLGDRYVVLRLLAGGSDFALTYLAHDARSNTAVVCKELLPRGLVGRSDGTTVRAHSPDAEREFARVSRRFVREGEILLDLRHDALPTALDVVEAHGTAYLVMPQHEALRLSDHLPAAGGRLPIANAVTFAAGLLGALETLHAEGILHREVSPHTVHVRHDGRPLLLGLGAWRHVPGRNREPVAGFDPIEQYGGRDVGPWSDVYGAAAVLYYLTTGNVPVSAIERAGGAQLRSPGVWARDVSPAMASAIVRGLALAPEGRPHSASELRRQLEDAVAMGTEPTLSRAMSVLPPELIGQDGATSGAFHDPDTISVPFALNSYGVVIPRDDSPVERTFRRVADVAARLTRRRSPERSEGSSGAAEPPPASVGRRLDPVYDAERARAIPPEERARPEPAHAVIAEERARPEPARAAIAPEESPRPERAHAVIAPEESPRPEPAHAAIVPEESPRPEPAHAAIVPEENLRPEPTRAVIVSEESSPLEPARGAMVPEGSSRLDPAFAAVAAQSMSIVTAGESIVAIMPHDERGVLVSSPESSTDAESGATEPVVATRRRRTPMLVAASLVAAAALAAVGVPTALRARASADRGARRDPPRPATSSAALIAVPPATAQIPSRRDSAVVVPQGASTASKGSTSVATVSTAQRSTTSRPSSSSEGVADLPRLPSIAAPVLTLPPASSSQALIAADVVVDARSRVSVASEQADQGNYAAARQTLSGALVRLDSAALGATDAESLRGVRREIEAAQKRTADACSAESELRRRHGQSALSCT